MNDLARGERLQIMLTSEELAVFGQLAVSSGACPGRAAAVRELLKRGLAAEGFGVAEGGVDKSEDFRVTGGSTASPTRDRRDGAELSARACTLIGRLLGFGPEITGPPA